MIIRRGSRNSAGIKLRFHAACYLDWRKNTQEGRRYISLKQHGQEASLPSYKTGNRPKEETLKIRWSLFWQHFAGERSYGNIAKQEELDSSSVQEGVEYIIKHLPAREKVDARYQPLIDLAKVLAS
jgi:hypothetical protein